MFLSFSAVRSLFFFYVSLILSSLPHLLFVFVQLTQDNENIFLSLSVSLSPALCLPAAAKLFGSVFPPTPPAPLSLSSALHPPLSLSLCLTSFLCFSLVLTSSPHSSSLPPTAAVVMSTEPLSSLPLSFSPSLPPSPPPPPPYPSERRSRAERCVPTTRQDGSRTWALGHWQQAGEKERRQRKRKWNER